MSIRVGVAPAVLAWAMEVAADPTSLQHRFQVDRWLTEEVQPTFRQLREYARAAGVPFGYLLLPEPPRWTLPIPDFREGFTGRDIPSADLVAVIDQSERRQSWYREYAVGLGAQPVSFVGSARDQDPVETGARIRAALRFEVDDRQGTWAATRKALLQGFEALGGLTVATSMVGNNTHRLLDADEFRGFTLIDDIAPLVFVNTRQTLNGQLFTLVHEFAHVWRGTAGIGNEDLGSNPRSSIERWCNAVASEVLVPREELEARHSALVHAPLTEALDRLAEQFRCGTLVILNALHNSGLGDIADLTAAYEAELARLRVLGDLSQKRDRSGGDHYSNQPYRIGERLSRALIADTLEGNTTVDEAMALMSMRSMSTFDEYTRRLGAA